MRELEESYTVFDPEELLDLACGDRALARELVDTFLDDIPKQLAELRAALQRGDGQELRRVAHKIKGSVGNFSAPTAIAAAKRLDEYAHSGEWSQLEGECTSLEREIQHLSVALREWADSL